MYEKYELWLQQNLFAIETRLDNLYSFIFHTHSIKIDRQNDIYQNISIKEGTNICYDFNVVIKPAKSFTIAVTLVTPDVFYVVCACARWIHS